MFNAIRRFFAWFAEPDPPDPTRYICEVCSYNPEFSSPEALAAHVEQRHPAHTPGKFPNLSAHSVTKHTSYLRQSQRKKTEEEVEEPELTVFPLTAEEAASWNAVEGQGQLDLPPGNTFQGFGGGASGGAGAGGEWDTPVTPDTVVASAPTSAEETQTPSPEPGPESEHADTAPDPPSEPDHKNDPTQES